MSSAPDEFLKAMPALRQVADALERAGMAPAEIGEAFVTVGASIALGSGGAKRTAQLLELLAGQIRKDL